MSKLTNILTGVGIGAVGVLAITQSLDYLNDRDPKIYTDLNSQQADYLPDSNRMYLKNNQASSFNKAISQAKEIQSDSPFFQQAQADITRWSKVILDIAYGRASEGDLSGAIAAAKLAPQNDSSTKLIAQKATEAVQIWQSRAQKQNLYQNYLAQAKSTIKPGQASSYNKAIGILQKINPEVEQYSEAQDLIEQWNEQIYLIADRRAKDGNLKQAAAAAALLSENSPYYEEAKKWQTSMKMP
ncbi:hypothetical protein [Pleurocapsa sp. FMAR1]|uniref:hypothetical protein n=1 Tax=Pleurocapsa sp. FMAR1 TaxID=3040204 RepID=UPI0029C8B690|nr:hypothetical protein [Pleurocapsa sp. FMAR1]